MASVDVPAVSRAALELPRIVESVDHSPGLADERSLLRWGGLSGVIGGIIFVVSIGYQVGVLGTATTASGAGPVMRFPGVQSEIVVGQTLFLAATVLLVPLFLALYRALRKTNLAAAFFGTGLSFLGTAVLAVESEPNVAMASISAQYHAAGATAAQQATAVELWQATQGMFNEFDTCAFAFLSVGLIILGIAMWKAPSFGKVFGGLSTGFGAAGLLGLSLFAVNSGAFSIFALLTFVIFPLLIGWRLYVRSGTPPDGILPVTG
jgi:hypothetical protein